MSRTYEAAAAAKWLHDNNCRSAIHSGFPADIECYVWLDEAKELLEAASPHLMAEAWDEGYDAPGIGEAKYENPYRSPDAV